MKIGRAELTITEDGVDTSFGGEVSTHARPGWSEEDFARAKALGYGDGDDAVRAMTREHDVMHSLLAEARGMPFSPVLWGVASGEAVDPKQAHDEECIVMLLQRVSQVGLKGILPDYQNGDANANALDTRTETP